MIRCDSFKAYYDYENGKQVKDRKGKGKICNLSRHSRDKFQERLDFKFYDFQAMEIEKGWNNLFVSIISIETGETIAKSGKASVLNGECHWEDSMLSTMWISDHSLQDNEAFLLKLVVAMGSARFGTLGEATINLASYIRPETSTASLPLKQHCSHGTILQVKIQCLTPRSKHRKNANSYVDEMSVGSDDVDSISDVSDNTFCRTSGSSHWDHLENSYYRKELSNHEVESSLSFWIGEFPQQSNASGLKKNMNERKDSTCSKHGPYPLYDASRSIYSSPVTSSPGTRLKAQVTIDLLHGEAKMWEENATKLIVDVERLRKHLKKKSKNKKELEIELSSNLKFQLEEMDNTIKELKDEIKYQKGLNCDLELKLKKTQESKIDLVSILQKLEKIKEKQKMEITGLSMNGLRFQDAEINSRALEDKENEAKWRNRLFEKGIQIVNFEKKLSDGVYAFGNEILALTQRVQDLEAELCKIDLKELTEAILCTIILLKKLLETKATSFEYEINSQDEELPNDMKFHDWTKNSQTLINKDDLKFESLDDEHNALFGLEAENAELSERIFGLEAEMRQLIEEKESTHLALENSENVVENLQAEIRRMEALNETQSVELKRKEESMQKKWIEAQEECRFLKVANLELQATNENLIKESKTLQTTNDELRMQNLELHSQHTLLESKLGESQIAFFDMLKLVEELEYKYTSVVEEIALKEKTINLDLDALLGESRKLDERFIMEEKFQKQMYLEKTAEVEDLHREVEHLRDQISDICDRHKRLASNIVLEVYDLCAAKAMLEAALQEEHEKVRLHKAKLDNLQAEYEVMEENYTDELDASRAIQETQMVNHEKVAVLLENSKANEEKLKGTVRGLEAELKASELERLQATEEISELEVQLQKTEMLHDEIFIHKRSLYEAEFEYRRLEASYQMLSLERDELKAKNISYIQSISTTEKITSELEDCKRGKIELEEKILRLQWNLTTKEASCLNNAQLKYEISQMTRENCELHRTKDSLQQENEKYKNKVKDLEEKLKEMRGVKQDQYDAKNCSTSTVALHDLKFLQVCTSNL
uniref:C2 NT-type domain-containing protein n=1 Tax=Cajanus cajan TaxID=3821 RepID=A0A151T0V5_CAJCA|nr:hypothetical protein KK1_023076 [Cajanus cajan]